MALTSLHICTVLAEPFFTAHVHVPSLMFRLKLRLAHLGKQTGYNKPAYFSPEPLSQHILNWCPVIFSTRRSRGESQTKHVYQVSCSGSNADFGAIYVSSVGSDKSARLHSLA